MYNKPLLLEITSSVDEDTMMNLDILHKIGQTFIRTDHINIYTDLNHPNNVDE